MKNKETPEVSGRTALIRVIEERPRRVFAVGDIHGYYQELSCLLDYLQTAHGASSEDLFIFIGDYIDRGPSSRQVIERMIRIKHEWPRTVFLKGNHEGVCMRV